MPARLPSTWIDAINRLNQTGEWKWCWEIEADISEDARSIYRLVSHTSPIVLKDYTSPLEISHLSRGQLVVGAPTSIASLFTLTDKIDPRFRPASGDAKFSPYPIKQSKLKQTAEGDLPSIQLTVDNSSGTLTRWFSRGQGFMNRRAAGVLVKLDDLGNRMFFPFRVAGITATLAEATFTLEMPNLMKRVVPEDRHDPLRCRFEFGGKRCGYVVNATAGLTTCGKTYGDCAERGDDEVSRNLPRDHPARFGAFPGLAQR